MCNEWNEAVGVCGNRTVNCSVLVLDTDYKSLVNRSDIMC
jgi:hypothetical protein